LIAGLILYCKTWLPKPAKAEKMYNNLATIATWDFSMKQFAVVYKINLL